MIRLLFEPTMSLVDSEQQGPHGALTGVSKSTRGLSMQTNAEPPKPLLHCLIDTLHSSTNLYVSLLHFHLLRINRSFQVP